MNETAENLVQVHHARDEWEGTIIVGYLRDNGIEATLRRPPSVPPLDTAESLTGSQKVLGILVLEHQAKQAEHLIAEFQAAVADDTVLTETAAHRLKLDQETIHRLRGELAEERKTFDALGWIVVVFLAASALLWAIWPAWLKVASPPAGLRWVVVLVFALGAAFVGSWTSRRMK